MDLLEEIRNIIREHNKKPPMILSEVGTQPLSKATVPGFKRKSPSEEEEPSNVFQGGEDDDSDVFSSSDLKAGNPSSQSGQSQNSSMGSDIQKKVNDAKAAGLKQGFNIYHGIMGQVFTEIHSMAEGGGGDVVKKMTQWALQHLGHDQETQDVFATNNQPLQPQQMAQIVQKAMLIVLNYVAKEAEKQSEEKHIFAVADK